MKPVKTYVWKLWCIWNGHQPTEGTTRYYGTPAPSIVCAHCYKHLRYL